MAVSTQLMMAQGAATQRSRPELLAPAGDWDALKAAIANGADAVYFGLSNFNARHRATNFTRDELPHVMGYLHAHNVRGYLTFNTLIFSDELPSAVEYLQGIAAAGVDAVIVQDLGIARLIHTLIPKLPIHGSTQMTLTEPRGIGFVRALGVQRVILARELSLAEIRKITANTATPVEVFVHGALCVAYSGQCLTSESLGGRSANRGQCAQACRLPYQLMVDGQWRDLGERAYLLSPQDLAAYDLIGELAEAGVGSFKIEGRLKSAHYVAATTQTYRQAIDQAGQTGGGFVITPQQKLDLEQSFSRGFTHGFLEGVNHQELVPARFPKARGTRLGTVEQINDRALVVRLEGSGAALKPGDGVVFDEGHPEQDEQGGRIFGMRAMDGGKRVGITLGHGDVNLAAIRAGAIVWKTDDPAVRRRLEHSFSRDTVVHRTPLTMRLAAHVGQPMRLTVCAEGQSAEAASEQPLEAARKYPLTEDMAREQLERLGDTPYALAGLTVESSGGPMAPKSVLNELRRRAVECLLTKQAERQRYAVEQPEALDALREAVVQKAADQRQAGEAAGGLTVLVRTMEQLEAALRWQKNAGQPVAMVYCDFEDIRKYKEAVAACRSAGMAVGLATLRIVKPTEEGLLRQIADCRPDAVLVRNLAAVSFYHEQAPELPQVGDYSLNVANELTAGVFLEAGLVRMTPSYDLNWKQLAAMLGQMGAGGAGRFEAVIHQHMPMFHMEHCVFAHTLSTGKDYHDCGRPCEQHRVDLADRVGAPHPLIPDVGCRNTLFNAQAQTAAEFIPEMKQLGIRYFRVELLRETGEEAATLLERYARVLSGQEEAQKTLHSLRVLHQLGVTRGTLDRE